MKKVLYITKVDGLRMGVPNDKLLAMWSVTERGILAEKQLLKQEIANIDEQLKSAEITQERREALINQKSSYDNSYLDLRPYAMVLIGYEKDRAPLQIYRVANEVDSVRQQLPSKSDLTYLNLDGGGVLINLAKIDFMEEKLQPEVIEGDLELPESVAVLIKLVYGEEHNRQEIVVTVDETLDKISGEK